MNKFISVIFLLLTASFLFSCGGDTTANSTVQELNNSNSDEPFDEVLLLPSEGGDGAEFNDGASWYYFNKAAKLEWQNDGGDYIDSNSAMQGVNPWAIQTISDTDSETDVAWDVTTLVNAWVNGQFLNRGFHLRYNSGSTGPIVYATKEATNSSHHPLLTVTTQNSGELTFSPIGDTQLTSSSTTVSFGQKTEMSVRSTMNALIWFNLSSLSDKTVLSAELKLTTIRQYTNTDTVHGLYAIKTETWDSSTPVTGLAELYPNDEGIRTHPDVYLAYSLDTNAAEDGGEDFLNDTIDAGHGENYWPCNSLSPAGRQSDGSMSTPELAIPGYNSLNGGNALCMRVKYEDGPARTQGLGNYGASVKKRVSDFHTSDQTDELFIRIYLFLGDTWGENLNDQGGKRPGGITGTQSGTAYAAGWGGRTTDGSNGWSARGGYFEIVPNGYNPLEGYTAIATYLYHADQSGGYGDSIVWGMTPNGLLKKGQWYCIEQQVKMNSRDGANIQDSSGANDGIVRGWVDGRLVFEKTDVRFTDMDYINIDVADFGLYYGGAENTPYDQHIAIDNIVISKSYVGPMKVE